MQPDLAAFLARHAPIAEESAVWGNDTPLRVTSYLGHDPPPLAYVTSVRGVVFRDDAVLVVRGGREGHIVPGGRREAGETLEETLRREVLEESGWALSDIAPLGFIHYHHLSPKRPGHAYPHPDFLQPVYISRAVAFRSEAVLPNEYEREPYTLRSIAEVRTLPLSLTERRFLDAALRVRAGRSAGA